MRAILACLALCLTPLAAQAQGIGFTAAMRMYYPGGEADLETWMLNGADIIPRIEGTWAEAHYLFPDGVYDADLAARSCDRLVTEITADGRFTFTLRRGRLGEAGGQVTRYALVRGNLFTRAADLDAVTDHLFPGRDPLEMPPPMLIGTIGAPSLHGYAFVRPWGDDVLVIEGLGYPPVILTRCPGN